ncbi:MAG: hypothetical protein ACKVX9_21890 [Blastocatellia bacterium]
MKTYKINSEIYGELMNTLMNERSRFDSEEEFQRFAVDEVRRFISELRSINIELAMRPNYSGRPISRPGGTQKPAR